MNVLFGGQERGIVCCGMQQLLGRPPSPWHQQGKMVVGWVPHCPLIVQQYVCGRCIWFCVLGAVSIGEGKMEHCKEEGLVCLDSGI